MTTPDSTLQPTDNPMATPFAWPQSGLEPRPWFPFTVAASPGTADVAERIAQRTERAYWFLRKVLGFTPRFRLLVISRADWPRYADVPTYGIPHSTHFGHLIVGSEPADAWHIVSHYLARHLPANVVRSLVAVHGRNPIHRDAPDLSVAAEALVAHELAHLMCEQAGATFPRRWMAEAFANYALIAVLGETDPLGLHRIGTLAEAGSLLPGDTPSIADFDAAQQPRDPVASVLGQLALTRGVFAAYADEQAEPLARWFALARRRPTPDADHELGRMLMSDVHPALAPFVEDDLRRQSAIARAA